MTLPNSVLIVGVGSIGERHLRCFQSTGRADVAGQSGRSGQRGIRELAKNWRCFINLERTHHVCLNE